MIESALLLMLAGGLPYYVFLEKNARFGSKQIFLMSALMLLCATALSFATPDDAYVPLFVIIAFASAVFSIYKATKTTNFYKLGYYLIFVNAPFFALFEGGGSLYSLSLLISLTGIYLTANFYEKNYASANYHYIRGITLATPYIGTFLTLYLIALALYPPFPNAIYFLDYLFNSHSSVLSYIVIITLFFGNFFLAMRVMKESLFGRPNANIHYVDLTPRENIPHFIVIVLLLLFSLNGLKEMLL